MRAIKSVLRVAWAEERSCVLCGKSLSTADPGLVWAKSGKRCNYAHRECYDKICKKRKKAMREILFRGKRVDNGEWVQGFLSKSRNIEEKPAELKFCIDWEEKGVMISSIVDPKTIGQYTGLTDKNGTKIFEGDILRATSEDTKEPVYAVVGYGKFKDPNFLDDDSVIGWYAEFRGVKTTILNGESEGCAISSISEVLSNIHDNPELLKEES